MTNSYSSSCSDANQTSVRLARPAGTASIRITRVKTVLVRKVPSGGGLIRPWDPNKIPLSTRDYVVVQFLTNSGLIGTTMDGDSELSEEYAATINQSAQYFVGKYPSK